jgi:hypothetical protein
MTHLIPPIAVILGWAMLGGTPPWLTVGGGARSLGGVNRARRD